WDDTELLHGDERAFHSPQPASPGMAETRRGELRVSGGSGTVRDGGSVDDISGHHAAAVRSRCYGGHPGNWGARLPFQDFTSGGARTSDLGNEGPPRLPAGRSV